MEKSKNNKTIKTNTVQFFGYKIFQGRFKDLNYNKLGVINTINAYPFFVAENNPDFHKTMVNADIIVPDGISICLGIKLLSSKNVQKVAGYDVLIQLLCQANSNGKSIFFLGSSDITLDRIKKKVQKEFPKIKVNLLNPGFNNHVSDFKNDKIIQLINDTNPDILFVGLSAPKQELWVNKVKSRLKVGTICSVGAAFDFYAGTKKRPAKFWINNGLEGIIRTIKEPRTQIRKDIKAYPYFIYRLIKEILNTCHKKQP